jgi:hypothetical protein
MVPVRRNPEGSNQVITPSQRSEKVTSLSKQIASKLPISGVHMWQK